MKDTPDHIKKIQFDNWMSKTPAERIRQFCIDNDMLFQFWRKAGNPHLEIPVQDSASKPTKK